MNPKHLSVRMDPKTGDLWLTEERFRKPIKRIANITSPVLLALAADIVAEEGTASTTRDVKFSDGHRIRITVEDLPHEDKGSEGAGG
jgi:hypothetical protein